MTANTSNSFLHLKIARFAGGPRTINRATFTGKPAVFFFQFKFQYRTDRYVNSEDCS